MASAFASPQTSLPTLSSSTQEIHAPRAQVAVTLEPDLISRLPSLSARWATPLTMVVPAAVVISKFFN